MLDGGDQVRWEFLLERERERGRGEEEGGREEEEEIFAGDICTLTFARFGGRSGGVIV